LTIVTDRGYLYMSEPAYRTLFNLAFGPTSWSLLPTTPFHTSRSGRTLFRSYILTINNRFISEAVGDWSLATAGGDRDEAERRCAHVAMVRVGKDLGVASELWDPRVVNGIRDRLFEVVVVDGVGGNTRVWRRKAGV
ncbi:mitochondrial genome maintenance MGM101, partial [Fimicolochytrium jonesii]|uniref:mitochondrial genome maintenance MGM101 n=1 Tax=Fimicolochytrium jonesii TaxID=1396493 RepID=UPI0022FE9FDA